jgi:thymidine phosphorylase
MSGAGELLRAKRDGRAWSSEEVRGLAAGIADGTLSDAQVGAFAMVAFLNGLDPDERAALTAGLRDTGTVLAWDGLTLDKHSTGGVGDKVSLPLAPILAACGALVPMISGRGLGHTGGTLDKLEAIPGYDATPGLDVLRRVVAEAGCAIIGQTDDLAPGDRRLYAVRDATGTVESVGLITASILSKKLAAGLDGLVLDVKTGSGAFMAAREDARELARSLVDVATANGLRCAALITDMDAPLGATAGNALEVREAIGLLTGEPVDPALREVTLALAARALALAGTDDARARARDALTSGAAAERFARMVAALGGPADLLERPDDHLPHAPVVRAVHPERAGHVTASATRAVGLAVTALGGGRAREQDAIDPAVGFADLAPRGAAVGPGRDDRPLAVVHAADDASAERAAAALRAAVTVGDHAPAAVPVVLEEVA